MRVLILDTYYPKVLAHLKDNIKSWDNLDFEQATSRALSLHFGTGSAYSYYLRARGVSATDLIVNDRSIQRKWAQENNINYLSQLIRLPERAYRIANGFCGLDRLSFERSVLIDQIERERPDVLYVQNISYLSEYVLRRVKRYVSLIVGQIASPLPPAKIIRQYNLILTSFPHFVKIIAQHGVKSEYFKIGFDHRILDKVPKVERDIPFSFIGGITRHHSATMLLEFLCRNSNIQLYGYGSSTLPRNSILHDRHNGELWGLHMYSHLARSRITLNRHISCAENYANNMRLFEATGMGCLLLTDAKSNLNSLFKVDSEVVTYSSPQEAAEKARYYLDHPEEAQAIARAGQARTLNEHTYEHRMGELREILSKYLH